MASSKTTAPLRRSSSVKTSSSSQAGAGTSSNRLKPSASWSALHTKSNGGGTALHSGRTSSASSPKPPAIWSAVSQRHSGGGFSARLSNSASAMSTMNCETDESFVPNGDVTTTRRLSGQETSSSSSTSPRVSVSVSSSTNNKHTKSQSTREIVQRLTNGGIPSVSIRRQRRYSLDLSATSTPSSRTSSETPEPKSILKNASRRCSISYGEISRGATTSSSLPTFCSSKPSFSSSPLSSGECSLTSSPTMKFCSDMDPVPESEPLPSEENILKNCHYRLGPGPVTVLDTGPKKVTFDDDVRIIQRGRRTRRNSVPNIK